MSPVLSSHSLVGLANNPFEMWNFLNRCSIPNSSPLGLLRHRSDLARLIHAELVFARHRTSASRWCSCSRKEAETRANTQHAGPDCPGIGISDPSQSGSVVCGDLMVLSRAPVCEGFNVLAFSPSSTTTADRGRDNTIFFHATVIRSRFNHSTSTPSTRHPWD